MHWPALLPRKHSWYSFLLEAELTSGPQCDQKSYVNEEFQWGIKPLTFQLVAQWFNQLHTTHCTFMMITHWILLRMRNVSGKSCKENPNTHFMFNKFFFEKSYCLWDNVERYGRTRQVTDDNIIWHMYSAHWITKAADTCSDYVILTCFSTATMVTWTCLNVKLYVHCLSYCVLSCVDRALP
jgi:hypothetical protein